MTDFRALCAELLEALENAIRVIYNEDGTKHISTADPVIAKADAALAQPAPQGPGRPAVEPVPVAERLPKPEDCDAEGRCWWWIVDQPGELPHWIYCQLEVLSWTNFTAWLPHHALPVPQQGE